MSKFYFRMTIKLSTIIGKSTIYQWRIVMLFMSKYYLGRSFGVQECILRKGSRFFSLPLESCMKSTNELCFCELSPYRYTLPKSRPGQACTHWDQIIFEIAFRLILPVVILLKGMGKNMNIKVESFLYLNILNFQLNLRSITLSHRMM